MTGPDRMTVLHRPPRRCRPCSASASRESWALPRPLHAERLLAASSARSGRRPTSPVRSAGASPSARPSTWKDASAFGRGRGRERARSDDRSRRRPVRRALRRHRARESHRGRKVGRSEPGDHRGGQADREGEGHRGRDARQRSRGCAPRRLQEDAGCGSACNGRARPPHGRLRVFSIELPPDIEERLVEARERAIVELEQAEIENGERSHTLITDEDLIIDWSEFPRTR